MLTFAFDELRSHNEFISQTTLKRGPDRTPDPPYKTTGLNFIDDNFEISRFKTPNTKHDEPAPASVGKVPLIEKPVTKSDDTPGRYQEIGEKQEDKLTTVMEKETDINYNNLFYNDEYKEVTTRKPSETSVHFIADEYDDKSKDKEVNSVFAVDKIEGPESNDDMKQSTTEKDAIHNRYNYELERETLRRTAPKNISFDLDISTMTTNSNKSGIMDTQLGKDVIKAGKKGQTCSMLKLRQLNFNSPRTLPEVNYSSYLLFFKLLCRDVCLVFFYHLSTVYLPRSVNTQVSHSQRHTIACF